MLLIKHSSVPLFILHLSEDYAWIPQSPFQLFFQATKIIHILTYGGWLQLSSNISLYYILLEASGSLFIQIY